VEISKPQDPPCLATLYSTIVQALTISLIRSLHKQGGTCGLLVSTLLAASFMQSSVTHCLIGTWLGGSSRESPWESPWDALARSPSLMHANLMLFISQHQ